MRLQSLMDDRGGIVFWMCMFPFVISAIALTIYGGSAYASKAICRSKLENALLNAVILSHPNVATIDANAARPYFDLYLQKNLNLNSDNMPNVNSLASSKVNVLTYYAINTTTPVIDTLTGDTVHKPSLQAEISVPVIGGYTINVVSRVAINP